MKLKQTDRYSTQELTEGQFEPGSQKCVYKNLLRIRSKKEMDKVEAEYLLKAFKKLAGHFNSAYQFSTKDIQLIHKVWLGEIYAWAGEYRRVNLSKGGFPFAAATQIPRLMSKLEKNELAKYTPCNFGNLDDIITAIAIVHTELVLIHPFREGNGRISRMLADLMALQAGLPLLDYTGINNKKRNEYFAAVQSGLNCDYEPMIKIFYEFIKRTLKNS